MLYKIWLTEWLNNYVMPSSKDKTYSSYRDIAEHHLIPKLGEYELQELTPLIVQCYITELLQHGNLKNGNPLSANTVNTIITVIQGSMSTAHLLGFTDKYEMDKLKRPKAKEKPVESFTPAEQKLIEQAVMADRREKMKGIIICLYTGLRIGELLALEWSDIDFQKAELTVSKTCHDGKNKNGIFCRITDTPKTTYDPETGINSVNEVYTGMDNIEVGDRIVLRSGIGAGTLGMSGCTGLKFEDVTIFSTAGFAEQDVDNNVAPVHASLYSNFTSRQHYSAKKLTSSGEHFGWRYQNTRGSNSTVCR